VSLSEFLPNPKADGTQEWAELANSADTRIDLSGWAIDDADGGGSPYRLPEGSAIAPHGLLVITLPKTLFNNDGDTVRLLSPDGTVTDQYAYAQSSADQSFCRAADQWSVCAPSPNAPNQTTVQASPAAASQMPISATQTLGLAASEAPVLRQQFIASNSAPVLQLPEAQPPAIIAASSYANPTSGVLYRGSVRATPGSSPSTPTTAAPATGRQDEPPVARSAILPLSMGAGLFLFLAGSVISGYDWMRSRRTVLPPVTDQALLLDPLEDELE
jgi:hypothetical protein